MLSILQFLAVLSAALFAGAAPYRPGDLVETPDG